MNKIKSISFWTTVDGRRMIVIKRENTSKYYARPKGHSIARLALQCRLSGTTRPNAIGWGWEA